MQNLNRVPLNDNNAMLNKSEINQIAHRVASDPKINNLINHLNELTISINQDKLRKIELENTEREIDLDLKKIREKKAIIAQKKNELITEQENINKQKIALMNRYGIVLADPTDPDQLENGMKLVEEKIQVIKQRKIEKQKKIAEQFFGIFHKEKPSNDQLKIIIDGYMIEKAFSEEKIDGKIVLKIQSMVPVINYMEANPQITLCKFIAFKSNVSDVATLCDYLKTADSKITAVGISKEISEESKVLLNSVSLVKRQFRVVCQ